MPQLYILHLNYFKCTGFIRVSQMNYHAGVVI